MFYPDDFVNKIHCADSLSFMKDIPDKSIDFILTDPPYNISQEDRKIKRDKINNRKIRRLISRRQNKASELCYDFGKWDHYNTIDLQLEFAEKWLSESFRVLKDNGQIVTFYSRSEISFLEYLMNGIGFYVRQTMVWHKTNPVPQIFKVGYMSSAEFMTWATKNKGAGHTFNYQLGQKHNVFTYPLCQGKERSEHPTQKPLNLLQDILQYHTNPNDLVLDPFSGSGSTALACKILRRNFIGIEMDKKYFEISEQRLKNYGEVFL